MDRDTIDLLLNLNRDFYDTYAQSFSSTRYTIQPGIRRLLPRFLENDSMLDLGCGNGNLAQALLDAGYTGRYMGLDNSPALLRDAQNAIPVKERDRYTFHQVDLAAPFELLSFRPDAIVSFAVIHHFPPQPYLQRFFDFASNTLKPGGAFFLSAWQVKNSERLRNRIQPWLLLGDNFQGLGEDDLLLDWRADPNQPPRFRYVHHYNSEALTKSGTQAGLVLDNEYFSDGKEGDLALYQVWRKA